MNTADIRAKTADQLSEELLTLRKEQLNLRIQKATGQLENTARVRQIRRTIATIKTVQKEQETGVTVAAVKEKAAKKPVAKKKIKE